MTNMPKFSKRAQRALEVLADGGRFVNMLERNNYTGREQFHMRLRLHGSIIRGIGHHTFYELKDAGMLESADGEGTSVSEPYKLRTID